MVYMNGDKQELETKEERVKTSIELWTKRRDQISSDLTREQELVSESQSALLRLSEERKTISKASNDDPKKIESANNLYEKLYLHESINQGVVGKIYVIG